MDLKRILSIAALAAVAYYLYMHRGGAPSPAPPAAAGSAASWDGGTCVRLAETANSELHQASLLLLKLPVDQGAWRDAEGRAQSAIGAAESACSGASSERDREVAAEVSGALSAMRTLLGELSAGASGGGGATAAVQRQETIDGHLDRARAALRK